MNFIEKAAQIAGGAETLSDWVGHGAVPVQRDRAQQRANVCLSGCPHHTSKSTITEAVALAIKKQIELKNHLQLRVDGEKSLHSCDVCGCAMRLKVWTPIEFIAPDPEEREKLWANCWLLKEA